MEDRHIKERRRVHRARAPRPPGPTTLLAPWIHLSKTPAERPSMMRPLIGQHTDEVLGGLLGLTEAASGDLRAQGVVK